MYLEIGDYGLIGNCRSCALVSREGSIDWSCLPDFDSQSYLCKILDENKGGYFKISPIGYYQTAQNYKGQTNILRTDFFNHSGRVRLTDLMPISRREEETNTIPEYGVKFVRRLKGKSGSHRLKLEIKVTPDYARDKAKITQTSQGIEFNNSQHTLILFSNLTNFSIRDDLVTAEFELSAGEEIFFGFGFYKTGVPTEFSPVLARKFYKETLEFWVWWSSLCRYKGFLEEEVLRSALTLKMLTFSPTGAIIAAPTTSLPEKIGAGYNWDYRYVWLRDASFSMYALLGLGYLKEAVEFMVWLEKVCLEQKMDLQIMYGLRGEKELTEVTLDHLEGYKKSKPVRIGNGAYDQKQLDIYGEVLTTLNLFVNSGGKLSPAMQNFVIDLTWQCSRDWRKKDAGIWEARDKYQHYTYSKLMCWVGIDRGVRIIKKLKLKTDVSYLQDVANQIKQEIISKGYDKKLENFTSFYGSKVIDSGNFNIPILGLLPPNDPLIIKSLINTTQSLSHDWFVYRTNDSQDELKAGEGTFYLATFWLVDSLSISGRVKEAKVWLEKLASSKTSLGLFAEEFDPTTKQQLGNFPQAFTHLGLINTALNLQQASKFGAESRATIPADRLKRVFNLFNATLEQSFELLIPSFLRRSLNRDEKRRTLRHSLIGRFYRKLLSEE